MSVLTAHSDKTGSIDGAIFDMDGVVTNTMEAHFQSWKAVFEEFLQKRSEALGDKFTPFTYDDYFAQVDGVPRYEGVRRFLKSRNIDLPEGDENEQSLESVHGLGNLKNKRFRDWLDHHKVRAYEDAIDLIRALKKRGLKVGVFSSSRNAERVLKSAGVSDLFDVKLTGLDADRLHLRGKPDPALLIETAKQLGSQPAHTAVVEDAISGIEAAAAGGFRPIIGANREQQRHDSHALALRANGADLVTQDLRHLVRRDDGGFKTMDQLPSAWQRRQDLLRGKGDRPMAAFLDYDGTLTPIVADYNKAMLPKEMGVVLRRLAHSCPVAIISGRDLRDVRNRVQLQDIYYAGSHGFDIGGPRGFHERPGEGERFLPALDAAEEELRNALESVERAAIERKTFAIAVHYRQVAEQDIAKVESAVNRVVAAHEDLRKGKGKKVFQVQPRTEWDKGHAVQWLLANTQMGAHNPLPLYIGDDVTDEDAFEALSGSGIGIVVCDGGVRATTADYTLRDADDVQRFLGWLAEQLLERTP